MKLTCSLCKGSGNLFCIQSSGVMFWWTCPSCSGCGTVAVFGPRKVGPGRSALQREGE